MTTIAVHELVEGRPDLLDELAAVRVETDAEVNPGDPPAPIAELAAEAFVTGEDLRRWMWVAEVDGEPAGELTLEMETDPANRHIAQCDGLAVRPRMRRRGVADALLRAGLDRLAAEGCTSLMLWSPILEPDAGGPYARRCGLTPRAEERCSRVRVADLDRRLLDRWIEEGRARTDGYRLVQFVGRVPEEHVDALAAAHAAMEDMPLDEMEWTIPTMTAKRLRTRDDVWVRAGRCNVVTIAIAPDGAAAGLSELQVNDHRPQLADQGDTGVRAPHRGRGLGRWLKAENLRQALELEPRIEVVETYNAQSNPWMLAINEAMGFRPHVCYQAFQGDLAGARAAVS